MAEGSVRRTEHKADDVLSALQAMFHHLRNSVKIISRFKSAPRSRNESGGYFGAIPKAEEYAQRLRGTLLSEQAAQEVIRRTQQYKQALTRAYNRLDQMKRRVNEWIREQLDRVCGGKHNFETHGGINTSAGKSGQNVRGQEEVPPPDIHPPTHVKERLDELARQGHGPQRHEGQVTEKQLDERARLKYDPETGTRTDAYTGNNHKCGDHATKINSEERYLAAEAHMQNTAEFKQQAAQGTADIKVEAPLEDIYGTDYKSHVSGSSRTAPWPDTTSPTVPADFTDGKMMAIYRRDTAGNYNLVTMYPNPK